MSGFPSGIDRHPADAPPRGGYVLDRDAHVGCDNILSGCLDSNVVAACKSSARVRAAQTILSLGVIVDDSGLWMEDTEPAAFSWPRRPDQLGTRDDSRNLSPGGSVRLVI